MIRQKASAIFPLTAQFANPNAVFYSMISMG
jgi:hypothetical protein